MELLFNELSVEPLCADLYKANDRMKQFAETVSTARRKGFKLIRLPYDSNQIRLAENYSLYNWLRDKNVPKNYKDMFFDMITRPFIKDGDETIETKYVEANYYFENKNKDNDIAKTECLGLASAYLYETLSISFSSLVWDKLTLSIIIEKEGGQTSVEEVFNVSSKESFNDNKIVDFIENLSKEVILIETTIPPDEKPIHLADHHGKAELQVFCDLLKHNPYIEKMHSTKWRGNQFIRKVQKDGSIELVLTKIDRRYALWVQTTGRNLRETKAIAEILKEKFT
jgi:hypothetical protein